MWWYIWPNANTCAFHMAGMLDFQFIKFFLGVLWMLRYVGKQLYCIQTSSQPSSKDQILQELGLR